MARCPECGSEFDPNDLKTFFVERRRDRRATSAQQRAALFLPMFGGLVFVILGHGAGIGFLFYALAPMVLFGKIDGGLEFTVASALVFCMALAAGSIFVVRGKERLICRLLAAEALCTIGFVVFLAAPSDGTLALVSWVTAAPAITYSIVVLRRCKRELNALAPNAS